MEDALIELTQASNLSTDEGIDRLEQHMLNGEHAMLDLPLTNVFTPYLYSRELFMPAGAIVTSRVHLTEHPYVVLSGVAHVFVNHEGVRVLSAGAAGVTLADSRRVLFIEEDCSWVTFHTLTEEEEQLRLSGASEDELVEVIEDRIFGDRLVLGTDKTGVELRNELLAKQEVLEESK